MSKTINSAVALGLAPSFGFGDRLGCATPGHLEALKQAGGNIQGIFAQQSIREMARTNRNSDQVMQAAAQDLEKSGYDQPWGADADHLKNEKDVDDMMAAGFVFFTIDPSDHVDLTAGKLDGATLDEKFKAVSTDLPWISEYQGKTFKINDRLSIEFDEVTLKRAVVKYGKAIEEGIKLGQYIKQQAEKQGRAFEIELSVDETDEPTTPAEHFLIADQFRKCGVELVSLAPRFVGDLEKGVDYIGDLNALEASLKLHNAIASHCGPYKLSLHSGSDKISMYPLLARATEGRFHVKTAGTSYLEALRVVARHDSAGFREMIDFCRDRYDTDRATYHVHAVVSAVPGPAQVASDIDLEKIYLERWADVQPGKGFTEAGRQILHCTFGSVLTDTKFGPLVHQILREHGDTYKAVLVEHFARHLKALQG